MKALTEKMNSVASSRLLSVVKLVARAEEFTLVSGSEEAVCL